MYRYIRCTEVLANTNTAAPHHQILNGVIADRNPRPCVPKLNHRWTRHIQMIPTGSKTANFKFHPSVDLDHEHHRPGVLVLRHGDGVEGSDGDGVTLNERRPDVGFLVVLVCRREGGPEADLLASIGGVDVHFGVVDGDLVVRVAGGDGDLEDGGEEIWYGGVEGVNGDVLEDESGFSGTEDGPHEEDDD